MKFERKGLKYPLCWNSDTHAVSSQDPRLVTFPPGWKSIDSNGTSADCLIFAPKENKTPDEMIYSNPRKFLEDLKRRGVNLKTIRLA